jgi:hypothetical protein
LKLDSSKKLQEYDEAASKAVQADTSIFHLMMIKGCSVHVCFKVDDERLEARSNDACTSVVQVGDVMIWIKFGTKAVKSGYETLCVEESSLRKLPMKRSFLSDAGEVATVWCSDSAISQRDGVAEVVADSLETPQYQK